MPKRIELYSVWKPPTSSCSASTRSNGGRLSSAVAAMQKMTNGTTPVRDHVPVERCVPACEATMSWVDSEPVSRTHGHHRQTERRLVADHLGRRPHRAEQRVLRARRPAGQHHAVDGDRRHGQQEQDADRRVGHLQVVSWPNSVTAPSSPPVKSPPMGTMQKVRKAGATDRYGASRYTRRSARSGCRSSLKMSLMPSASVWRMPHGPGPVGADPVLHVGDDLALEPDHEDHADQHEGEADHALTTTKSDDAEVDAVDEERVGRSGAPIRPVSTRTSVTGAGRR